MAITVVVSPIPRIDSAAETPRSALCAHTGLDHSINSGMEPLNTQQFTVLPLRSCIIYLASPFSIERKQRTICIQAAWKTGQ